VKGKTLAAPGEEECPIPPRYWYEIFDRFTRRDELLVEILKDVRRILAAIPELKVTITPELIAELKIEAELIDSLARRLEQLPNRLDKIEIDTSKTSWRSLRSEGELKGDVLLGFHIEHIGGGFTYKVVREDWESEAKTAVLDDKWDIEWDDLAVSGSGTTGTAVLWYWWREV